MNPRNSKGSVAFFAYITMLLVIGIGLPLTLHAQAVCGDGVVDPFGSEECDDGNNVSCDGCSATCEIEVVSCDPGGGGTCGNGELDLEQGEQCDDGNNLNCDGCSATCQEETESCEPEVEPPPPEPENEEIECTEDAIKNLLVQFLFGFFSSTVPTTDIPQSMKEAFEDCVAWVKSGAALEKITDEAVKYVSSGFDGNPAFVTNIGREFGRTGDNTFISFTQSGWISSVSPSIRDNLVFNLITSYNERNDFGSRIGSTLDEDLYDVKAFIGGNFNQQGGWGTWFKLTQEPQNNLYGALRLAQEEADRQIEAGVQQKQTELSIGNGFLSRRVCEPSDAPPLDDGSPPQPTCKIVTLGNIIGTQLNKTLGSGVDLAVTADELNEPLSSLHKGLITQALAGEGGIIGLGDFIETHSDFNDATIEPPGSGGGGGATGELCANTNQNPGSGVVTETIPFWEAESTGSDFRFKLPLTGHYTQARISFDFFYNEFPPIPPGEEDWTTIMSLRTVGNPHAEFFRILVAGDGDSIISLIGNSNGEEWYRQGPDFQQGQWYTITADYSAGSSLIIKIGPRGGSPTRTIVGTPASSIFPLGNGAHIIFSDGGNENKGLVGSRWEDFTITLTPGAAICGGSSGGGTGGGTTGGGSGSGGGSTGGGGGGGSASQCGPYFTLGPLNNDFMLGVSYYGGAGETNSRITSDINQLANLGFNNLRVWATWGSEFAPNSNVLQPNGNLNSGPLSKLIHIVQQAQAKGMTVDVTFAYGIDGSSDGGFNNYREGIQKVTNQLKQYNNVFFDLGNEHTKNGASHLSEQQIKQLVNAVHAIDSDRLVTGSTTGSPTNQGNYTNGLYNIADTDFATPHFHRDENWAVNVGGRITTFRNKLSAANKNKVIHLQEENRNGWNGETWTQQDFRDSLRNTILAGAGGWVFHNDAGYNLVNGNFFNQLDGVESAVIDDFEGIVNNTQCVVG